MLAQSSRLTFLAVCNSNKWKRELVPASSSELEGSAVSHQIEPEVKGSILAHGPLLGRCERYAA